MFRVSASCFLICLIILSCSCARTVVKKRPDDCDSGVRFYRPKPYLFIAPAQPATVTRTATSTPNIKRSIINGDIDNSSTVIDSAPISLSISIEYLPDYDEEYSIRMKPGLGIAKLDITLENGWNLTNVNSETDQKTADIIGSIAPLASAIASFGKADAEVNRENGECSVPFGFYEAVIGRTENNRRGLLGWRYVGFAPISGCSTTIVDCPGKCDCAQLFKLVADSSGLKFQRIENNCPNCLDHELGVTETWSDIDQLTTVDQPANAK